MKQIKKQVKIVKKTKVSPKKETKPKKDLDFLVTVRTSGKEYQAKAPTVAEALVKINLEWFQIKGKAVIIASRNGKEFKKVFSLSELKKIFADKFHRMMWGQRFTTLLK